MKKAEMVTMWEGMRKCGNEGMRGWGSGAGV
jgi:hypothetical protein